MFLESVIRAPSPGELLAFWICALVSQLVSLSDKLDLIPSPN